MENAKSKEAYRGEFNAILAMMIMNFIPLVNDSIKNSSNLSVLIPILLLNLPVIYLVFSIIFQ